MKKKSLFAALGALFIGVVSPSGANAASSPQAVAATGTIAGNIGNAGTGRLLKGARVELPQLALSALTDETGRFTLNDVRWARTKSS